ncbi:MAG: hypothetical protein Q8P30_00235 [Candidatus Uhrbacteria bacterium]|nr:hypothetical protein [Candidatus Uhrbacteria bacterium]
MAIRERYARFIREFRILKLDPLDPEPSEIDLVEIVLREGRPANRIRVEQMKLINGQPIVNGHKRSREFCDGSFNAINSACTHAQPRTSFEFEVSCEIPGKNGRAEFSQSGSRKRDVRPPHTRADAHAK